jgi:hypothetical protein
MDDATYKKLTKNFPKEVVKPAPKGKFGSYVPHHIYTQRLVDVIPGGYDFTYEVVRAKDNSIIGAKCKLYIKSTEQTIEEVGDVDVNAVNRKITESELLKLAVSDGIKRCCMRLGIGLELWSGGVSEEDFYADDEVVVETKPKAPKEEPKEELHFDVGPPVNNAQEINEILTGMEPEERFRKQYKKEAFDKVVAKGFPTEVNDWTEEQVKDFIEEFADVKNDISDLVQEIPGKIKYNEKKCPECGKSENIEDNREKKQSDPGKFGKIPSWACSKYNGANGCGWVGWDDDDCPPEWR